MADQDTGERFNFAFALHAKLSRGGSLYQYRCDDFGITCAKGRASRQDAWSVTFTADALEGQTFDSLGACVAALRALVESRPVEDRDHRDHATADHGQHDGDPGDR